jgi:hypothetical protein
VLFKYITRQTSNEIFSPSNKPQREVGRAKDLSAPPYVVLAIDSVVTTLLSPCYVTVVRKAGNL